MNWLLGVSRFKLLLVLNLRFVTVLDLLRIVHLLCSRLQLLLLKELLDLRVALSKLGSLGNL